MNWTGGYFENPINGYRLQKIPQTNIYIFTLDPDNPLTYRMPEGDYYQPDKHFKTDMASIPKILQWIPGLAKDSHLLPALFHDAAYKHKYIWHNGHKLHLTRKEADTMLRELIQAEGGKISAWVYYIGVRIGGWASW